MLNCLLALQQIKAKSCILAALPFILHKFYFFSIVSSVVYLMKIMKSITKKQNVNDTTTQSIWRALFLLPTRTSNHFFLYAAWVHAFPWNNNDKTGMRFVLHFSAHGSKRVSIFYTPINMRISAKDNAKSLKILKTAPRIRFRFFKTGLVPSLTLTFLWIESEVLYKYCPFLSFLPSYILSYPARKAVHCFNLSA